MRDLIGLTVRASCERKHVDVSVSSMLDALSALRILARFMDRNIRPSLCSESPQ